MQLSIRGNALLSMGLLQAATTSYLLADERGFDHDAVNQNLSTLSQVALLIDAAKYEAQPSSRRDKNRITLQFSVPNQEEERNLVNETLSHIWPSGE